MCRPRRPKTRHRQFAGIGTCRVEEIAKRAVLRHSVDENDLRRAYEIANRLEAGQRIIAYLPKMRIDEKCIGRHQQGVPVGWGVRYILGTDCSVRQQAVSICSIGPRARLKAWLI
jgi:hypothetical protein